MKRILLFVILIVCMSSSVTNAKITRGYDKFYGGVVINSWGDDNKKEFNSLIFRKTIAKDVFKYEIVAKNEETYNLLLAEKNGNEVE